MVEITGILTNKYFVVALIIAFLMLLYLYNRNTRQKCPNLENFMNVIDFEKRPDNYHCQKLKTTNSKRDDFSDVDTIDDVSTTLESKFDSDREMLSMNLLTDEYPASWPKPMDDRPDLGNCICHQPDHRMSNLTAKERYIIQRLRRQNRKSTKPSKRSR